LADFIASSNTLGAQAEEQVAHGSANEIKAFIHTLQGFEQNVQNFDAAQGGVFEARFDNELLGKNSTVGADVAATNDLTDIVSGSKSAGDAFTDMANQIIRAIEQMIIKMIVEPLMRSLQSAFLRRVQSVGLRLQSDRRRDRQCAWEHLRQRQDRSVCTRRRRQSVDCADGAVRRGGFGGDRATDAQR
jgi:hypothetical protein